MNNKFINSLKSEQERCEMILQAALMTENLTVSCKNYDIVSKFEELTEGKHLLDYLEGMVHNFTYQV